MRYETLSHYFSDFLLKTRFSEKKIGAHGRKSPINHHFSEIWDFIGLFWSFSIKKVRKRPNFTHKSGLFLHKKPRKRPVLQAATSFFLPVTYSKMRDFLYSSRVLSCFFLLTMVASISNVFADENFAHKLFG